MPSPDLTITQVARRAGIRPAVIRDYESISLPPAPPPVNGRHDVDVLQQLTTTVMGS